IIDASRGEVSPSAPALTRATTERIQMTQADRVHSTPRTTAPKIDQARRHLLTAAAAGAIAAAIPTAALTAAAAVDPIYAAIERHKQVAAAHDAAVDVRGHF